VQTPAAMPLSPILGGEDALGALERDLDDRLRADAWRPATGPSPWQVRPARFCDRFYNVTLCHAVHAPGAPRRGPRPGRYGR
jgi:hypothetical protein